AVWYFAGRGKEKNEMATRTTTTDNNAAKHAPVAIDNTSNNMAKSARTSTKVRLANGTELEAYAGGVEEKLVNCLDDAACTAGKDKWFDFDNINFETGSANLTPESQAQVKNIVAVLNAYPKAKIKIGGYTDKTGNAASNQKLSQQRADAVMNAIKAAGAKPEQVTGAEGYGSTMAKMPASASDEERRADRRISVQLREK
ncbi:MAG TPA: OmpA family protein, partial [Flavisolibacter sp.]|nr:OmpA family protein [Flavisolibacter sp.]